MAVGAQATVTGLNQQLSNTALALRNLCFQIKSLSVYANTQGAAGLQALGFSTADSSTFTTMVGYMNTIAGCYYGTIQQGGSGGSGAALFDFDNALSGLWGGQ